MKITTEQLIKIMPASEARAPLFIAPINEAMAEFEIITPKRIAAFLPNLAHESGQLRYMRELASGEAYEGRLDLGNTEPGDGVRFVGRGPIQITGRRNYHACSLALYGDERLIDRPELLEQPADGCRAAGWFWGVNKLNVLADKEEFIGICGEINCGSARVKAIRIRGLADRLAFYKVAKEVLK